jgi:predicted nucleic acid-binding protein
MRVVLDACVLFPTGLRGLLMDAAKAGYFKPLWSPRILDEWRLAAEKQGSDAGAEIALLAAGWPDAAVDTSAVDIEALWLPDTGDRHVLAAAIAGQAAEIVTANLRDFPSRVLARHGLTPRHPDTFLLEIAQQDAAFLGGAVREQVKVAEAALGISLDQRTFLKRAGLPRLAKLLAQPG